MTILPIFITARLGSTRLPRKHLLPMHRSRPALACLIERLSGTTMPLVLCIPRGQADDALANIAESMSIDAFRGDAENVLLRYHQALTELSAPAAVVVDADDPFVCCEMLKCLAKLWDGHDAVVASGLPWGGASYVLSRDLLTRMIERGERSEFWSTKLNSAAVHRIEVVDERFTPSEREYRLTLDYEEDLEYQRAIYVELGLAGTRQLSDVVSFITANLRDLARRFPAVFDGTLYRRGKTHAGVGATQ